MRFYGAVGYGATVDQGDGVWADTITEVSYYGNVVRSSRQLQTGEKVNADLTVQNSISIVADAYANENFMNIRYVVWAGIKWTVSNVQVQPPRLVLTLGEVYNGPVPS